MKTISRRDVLLGLLAAPLASTASASSDGWIRLGSATVRRSSLQSVEIRVDPSVRLISHLKLRVRKTGAVLLKAVHMTDLTVTFGDGEQATLPIQSVVALGGTTAELDLSERTRTVRRVRLHYELVPRRRVLSQRTRGTVELWGRR